MYFLGDKSHKNTMCFKLAQNIKHKNETQKNMIFCEICTLQIASDQGQLQLTCPDYKLRQWSVQNCKNVKHCNNLELTWISNMAL